MRHKIAKNIEKAMHIHKLKLKTEIKYVDSNSGSGFGAIKSYPDLKIGESVYHSSYLYDPRHKSKFLKAKNCGKQICFRISLSLLYLFVL